MFTTGQLIFAGLFIVVFVLFIFFSYKEDKKIHLKNYGGVIWVLFSFVIFLISLFIIKYFLKN